MQSIAYTLDELDEKSLKRGESILRIIYPDAVPEIGTYHAHDDDKLVIILSSAGSSSNSASDRTIPAWKKGQVLVEILRPAALRATLTDAAVLASRRLQKAGQ